MTIQDLMNDIHDKAEIVDGLRRRARDMEIEVNNLRVMLAIKIAADHGFHVGDVIYLEKTPDVKIKIARFMHGPFIDRGEDQEPLVYAFGPRILASGKTGKAEARVVINALAAKTIKVK